MKFLIKLFRKYSTLNNRVAKYTTFKDVLLSTLLSIISCLVILVPIIFILIPLFTLTQYLTIMIIITFIVGIMMVFLYYWFYYFYLKKFCPKVSEVNTRFIMIAEFLVISLILVTIGALFVAELLRRM